MNQIYFLHGLESSGQGTKGRYLRQHFPHVTCPDFDGTLAERLGQFERLCQNQQQLILVGSSFGGLMATCHAIKYPQHVSRLILMAPALNFEEFNPPSNLLSIPTLVVIGKEDTVTPPGLVIPKAKTTFSDLEIQLMDDDHMLHNTYQNLDWQKLLVG